ncbi:MAG: hypothetical protein ABI939_02265 [Anaerolineaceae bacterium]
MPARKGFVANIEAIRACAGEHMMDGSLRTPSLSAGSANTTPPPRRVMKTILYTEEEHANDMLDLLDRMEKDK